MTWSKRSAVLAASLEPLPPSTRRKVQTAWRWMPWIMAYTGGRASEVVRLRGNDFRFSNAGSTPFVVLGGDERPPQNQAEIDRYCNVDEDGSLLLDQCDVPEKGAALIVVEWLFMPTICSGACWVMAEARTRRERFLDSQRDDHSEK